MNLKKIKFIIFLPQFPEYNNSSIAFCKIHITNNYVILYASKMVDSNFHINFDLLNNFSQLV